MSSSDNFVSITGNITRDPELRFTPSGAAVAKFGVAVNRRWQNKTTQEWEEQVSFFDVTVWQQLAENVAETFTKGDRVTVHGRLQQNTWETEAGEKRSKVEVVADDVAPSLRWATATMVRNPKAEGSGQPQTGVRQQPGEPDWGTEEPF